MTYNMSEVEASVNILQTFTAVNTLSDNILVNGGLIVFWVILFFSLLKRNPAPESFTAASGVCAILELFFLAMNLTSIEWVIGFSVLFAMSAIGAYLRNKTT